MIRRGMKPGDRFVDGKRTYEVVRVNADGSYHAKAVQEAEPVPTEAQTEPDMQTKPRRKRTAKK